MRTLNCFFLHNLGKDKKQIMLLSIGAWGDYMSMPEDMPQECLQVHFYSSVFELDNHNKQFMIRNLSYPYISLHYTN